MISAILRRIFALKETAPAPVYNLLLRIGWGFFWTAEHIRLQFQLGRRMPRLHYSERAIFAERFCSFLPISSALEVGSAFGQSFHILAKLLPDTKFIGIEQNPLTVESANEVLAQEKIQNAALIVGDGADLSAYADRSMDVVFSSAALLYVNPQQIRAVISEMIRVARKALILLELHHENPYYAAQHLGTFIPRENGMGGYWLRDYKSLIQSFLPKAEVKVIKIDNAFWGSEPWQEFGCVIELRLR